MITIALSIAPIFLLIVTGYALRRGGIPSEEFWTLNDRLVYFVLDARALLRAHLRGGSLGPQPSSSYRGGTLLRGLLRGHGGSTAAGDS